MAELIKQAHLIAAELEPGASLGPDGIGDVLIEAGTIQAIAPQITSTPAATTTIDARGQYLGPGLIDLYSHSGEPGHESRETIESLLRAAAAGGFTRVGILPSTVPVVDQASLVTAMATAAGDRISEPTPLLMPWAAITRGTAGTQLTDLAELAAHHALGFSDGQPLEVPALLRRLLEYAQPLQKPIALWPCDRQIVGDGVVREGVEALQLGLSGISAIAETAALAALLEYVAQLPTLVHIMRVSTERSVELLRQAKANNSPISASVPWHHLLLDTQTLHSYDPSLRHDPPLGRPTDREALIAGLREGTIDAIAVDHTPYTYEEKTVAFTETPPGAIGLELALPLLWQTFVSSGQWRPEQLWHCLSQGPAHCIGQVSGQLKAGQPAELALFAPDKPWTVTTQTLQSQSSNTPWLGQTLQGRVQKIWVPGSSHR